MAAAPGAGPTATTAPLAGREPASAVVESTPGPPAFTAGDLAARATVRGPDEIGVMARTFNLMAERLQARVRDEESTKEGLAERVKELDLLNRMGELFQACLSLEEAYGVIGRLAPRLFPAEAGAVFALSPARNLIEGRILVHRDGYGFVIPKEKIRGIESDIYIPAALMGSAMNGDKVKVEMSPYDLGKARITYREF